MRPCDCKDKQDEMNQLNEQGIGSGSDSIMVDGTRVILYLQDRTVISIPGRTFRRFAEWYLENQVRDHTLPKREITESGHNAIYYLCKCECFRAWVEDSGKVTDPCPGCGRRYVGKYSPKCLGIDVKEYKENRVIKFFIGLRRLVHPSRQR